MYEYNLERYKEVQQHQVLYITLCTIIQCEYKSFSEMTLHVLSRVSLLSVASLGEPGGVTPSGRGLHSNEI